MTKGVSKIKKKCNEIKKDILMKTSTLFRAEKLKRKHIKNLFEKKFSLFVSSKKRKSELFSKRRKSHSRQRKTKKKEIDKKRTRNKENLFFSKKKNSQDGLLGWRSKRRSLVNISRAYSKYKHSILDLEKPKKRKKKNLSVKKQITGKRRKALSKGLEKRSEREDSHVSRNRFIEINKCRAKKTN